MNVSEYTRQCPEPTGIEAMVCDDIARRQQMGIQKYGTTLGNNPLTHIDRLRHAYGEALDLAIYLKNEITRLKAHESADGHDWL